MDFLVCLTPLPGSWAHLTCSIGLLLANRSSLVLASKHLRTETSVLQAPRSHRSPQIPAQALYLLDTPAQTWNILLNGGSRLMFPSEQMHTPTLVSQAPCTLGCLTHPRERFSSYMLASLAGSLVMH